MTKTFKQIREQDYSWQTSMRQKHRGGTKGTPKLFVKKYSRDSTSGSLTDKQIQNLKKTWNDPSKIFTKDTEQFVKNMVKKLDNDSRHRLAKAGIKHISKLAESGDVPKDHEYGPSSRKRPAGKRGYTSSDNARTTHLKTIKKWSKKKRRQGDKEFASEEVRGSLFKKGAKVKYVGDNPRYKGKTGTIANVHGTEDNVKYAITGFLKGTLAITVGAGDIRYAYQQREEVQEANWSISPEKQKEVNKFLAKSTGGSMHQDVNLVMKKFGLSKSKAQDMVFNWMSSWSPDKRLSAWGPKDMPEEVKEDWQDTGKWKGRARLRQTQANFAVLGDGKVLSTHGAESTAKKQADGFKKSGRWKNIKIVAKEESPANATGTAVAGTGDDSSTVLVKKRKELQKRLMRRFAIKETLDKILPDPVETEDELTTRKNQLKELAKRRND